MPRRIFQKLLSLFSSGGADGTVPELLLYRTIEETDTSGFKCPACIRFHLLHKSTEGLFVDDNGRAYSTEVQRFMRKDKGILFGMEGIPVTLALYQKWSNAKHLRFGPTQCSITEMREMYRRLKASSLHVIKLVKDVTRFDVTHVCHGSCGHVAVVAALHHISPDLSLDVTELVQKYSISEGEEGATKGVAIRKQYKMNILGTKHAVEDILKRANPPILASVDLEKMKCAIAKPGTRVSWRQVESRLKKFKQITSKGKLRGAFAIFHGDDQYGHGTYIGIEGGGRYSTLDSMSGRRDDE